MAKRFRALRHPAKVIFDGKPIQGDHGEPLAVSILASGAASFARSPKFHRPRGPACMRGACDGCLARVDGVPNVMTCLTPTRNGVVVESQNTLGPRDLDLLRATDWFFPEGMNHHELFAGIPGVQNLMQSLARRVAGLGTLPDRQKPTRTSSQRRADVIIVGSGPSGIAVARQLVGQKRQVEVVDDAIAWGGGLRALDTSLSSEWGELWAYFERAVTDKVVRFRGSTTAVGIFGSEILIVDHAGAELVSADTVVLATGAHDGVVAFEGNDLPGVFSARAAGILLNHGVLPGRRSVLSIAKGGGPFGEAYARNLKKADPSAIVHFLDHGEGVSARGISHVKGVLVTGPGKPRRIEADTLIIDAPRSAAYELCEQAGAQVELTGTGFRVKTDDGLIANGIWAFGEVTGLPLEPSAIVRGAESLGEKVRASFRTE